MYSLSERTRTEAITMFRLFNCLLLLGVQVSADYDCICNYNVEKGVYAQPNINGKPIGMMYEFDCKPTYRNVNESDFLSIQFEHKVGYVQVDIQTPIQICPGEISSDDKIMETTKAAEETSTVLHTAQSHSMHTNERTHFTEYTSMIISTSTSRSSTTTTTSPITTPNSTPTTSAAPKSMTSTAATLTTANYSHLKYGTAFIGVGYNLLLGNPYGHLDPGILAERHIFKLTPNGTSALEVSNQYNSACSNVQTSYIITGTKSYQSELFGAVRLNSTVDDHLNGLAFTLNSEFIDIQHIFSAPNGNILKDIVTTCTNEAIKYGSSHTNHVAITPEFASAVCRLHLEINNSTLVDYFKFLDQWGTNIVTEVEMGTKTVQRYKTTYLQMYQRVSHQDSAVIQHGGPIQGYASSLLIDRIALQQSIASHSVFGGLIETKTIGSVSQAEPVGLTLVPISAALDLSYWRPVMDELKGICTVTEDRIKQIARNINNAIQIYPDYKNQRHLLPTDNTIQIPVTWPSGTYGLMEAAQGCPGANTIWLDGYVFQDTEDKQSNNYYSPSINSYLKGAFGPNNIQTHFCIKTNPMDSIFNLDWPSGTYCILRKGQCPSGFGTGYIYWDDEDLQNGNSRDGHLPDGQFDLNTKIYYCCRNDASPSKNITLPVDRPFILLRYGATCQSVYGMNLVDVFVRWDDYDFLNQDSSYGMHPSDDGGSKDHLLHFCHYQSSGTGPAIIG